MMVRGKIVQCFFSLVTVFLVLIIVSLGVTILGFQLMTVLSGSMEPALKAGDVIVVNETVPEKIKVEDIITYQVAEEVVVTHRVKEIVSSAEGIRFKTKGDANKIEDGLLIEEEQLLGRVVFRIPYGGYLADFVRSRLGYAFFIVIPVVILFCEEAKKIFGLVRK
jgi:signal peptidase